MAARPTGRLGRPAAWGSPRPAEATLPRAEGGLAAAPPNGSTGSALGGHPPTAPVPVTEAVPPAPPRTSDASLVFIEKEEELPGVSNTLHHPFAASGVTLGPGYDMKKKSADNVIADLKKIGIATDVAEKISGAAHLPPGKIQKFIKDNKSLIDLSSEQQARLLALTIGPYQNKVRSDIDVPLKPYEFDALVSFLYDPGCGWPDVRDAVNDGDYQTAALAMKKQIKSGGKVLQDLARRRQREVDLLLNGDYGTEE